MTSRRTVSSSQKEVIHNCVKPVAGMVKRTDNVGFVSPVAGQLDEPEPSGEDCVRHRPPVGVEHLTDDVVGMDHGPVDSLKGAEGK
ncbi:MAG: hypothetical protein IPP62_18590 [bacterium]|nr:hypothetical protein [bacterium]